jgi:SOS-response transcriptional repressor LexA
MTMRAPLRIVARAGPQFVEPSESTAWRTCVPFVPLRAAASGFSPEQTSLQDPTSALHWLTWPEASGLSKGMFAARVVGRSMEPGIPSGSVCLFRPFTALQTHDRPVLVRCAGARDPETGGEFTVKRLFVEQSADGGTRIELRPENPDFARLHFGGSSAAALAVVAEVVQVLGSI